MASARPEIVDTNHQRAEILERANGLEVNQGQACGHERNKHQSDFQIRVGHHGIAVLFQIEPLGVLEARIVLHSNNLLDSTAEDPPEVPLKM